MNPPYIYSIKINTSSCSCNNINGPYAKLCVPDIFEIKVFNLLSRTNQAKHIKWTGICKYNCSLDTVVCNNKEIFNNDKCRCKCKELIDKGISGKGFIWNPSIYDCDCDVGE